MYIGKDRTRLCDTPQDRLGVEKMKKHRKNFSRARIQVQELCRQSKSSSSSIWRTRSALDLQNILFENLV
jgi:hypothetical protein